MRLLDTSRRFAARYGASLALLAASFVYCYFDVFSSFAAYDDEGYLLISVKKFVDGEPLYDRVYSQYGPAYYFFNYVIFGWGLSVDHDAVRLLTIALRSIASLFCALFVQRMTRSLFLALSVYGIVLFDLGALVAEPGHPQGLNTLLITSAVCLSSLRRRSRRIWYVVVGLLAAVVVLAKINVGVFLSLAILLVSTTGARGDRIAALAGVVCSAAVLVLPAALLWRHLGTSWGGAYASVASLSLVPILIAAWRGPHRDAPGGAAEGRGYLWFTAGLVLGIAAGIAITLASGTSLGGLLEGALIRPLGFSSLHVAPAHFPMHTIVPALCSVAFVLGLRPWSREHTALRRTPWLRTLLKAAFPLLVLSFSGRRDAVFLLNYALPWLWVVLVPDRRSEEETSDFFPRLLLVSVAALQALQAYPVAGTQLVLATFLMIPCAALCAHDLANELFAQWPTLRVDGGRRRIASVVATWVIAATCASLAYRAYRHHQDLVPLELPGAERLRLPERDVALYRWMALNLRAHCDRFVTVPGYGSLYFWTQQEPPTTFNTGLWWILIDPDEQQEVVAALAAAPRACVISWLDPRWLAQMDVGGRPASTLPLGRYILENFETVGRVGRYEFMVRRGRERVEPLHCAIEARSRIRRGNDCFSSSRSLTLVIPASPGRSLRRVSVIEHVADVSVGDTEERPGICRIELCDEQGRRLDLSAGQLAESVDLSRPRQLTLRVPAQCELGSPSLLLFRLYDVEGRRLPPLRFMSERPH